MAIRRIVHFFPIFGQDWIRRVLNRYAGCWPRPAERPAAARADGQGCRQGANLSDPATEPADEVHARFGAFLRACRNRADDFGQRPLGLADGPGNRFGAYGIGTDEAVRPVLLRGACRDDDPRRAGQIGLDLLPRRLMEQHRTTARAGSAASALYWVSSHFFSNASKNPWVFLSEIQWFT